MIPGFLNTLDWNWLSSVYFIDSRNQRFMNPMSHYRAKHSVLNTPAWIIMPVSATCQSILLKWWPAALSHLAAVEEPAINSNRNSNEGYFPKSHQHAVRADCLNCSQTVHIHTVMCVYPEPSLTLSVGVRLKRLSPLLSISINVRSFVLQLASIKCCD